MYWFCSFPGLVNSNADQTSSLVTVVSVGASSKSHLRIEQNMYFYCFLLSSSASCFIREPCSVHTPVDGKVSQSLFFVLLWLVSFSDDT